MRMGAACGPLIAHPLGEEAGQEKQVRVLMTALEHHVSSCTPMDGMVGARVSWLRQWIFFPLGASHTKDASLVRQGKVRKTGAICRHRCPGNEGTPAASSRRGGEGKQDSERRRISPCMMSQRH